jgi:hypothetical protein
MRWSLSIWQNTTWQWKGTNYPFDNLVACQEHQEEWKRPIFGYKQCDLMSVTNKTTEMENGLWCKGWSEGEEGKWVLLQSSHMKEIFVVGPFPPISTLAEIAQNQIQICRTGELWTIHFLVFYCTDICKLAKLGKEHRLLPVPSAMSHAALSTLNVCFIQCCIPTCPGG